MQGTVARADTVRSVGLNPTAFSLGETDDTKSALIDYNSLSEKHDVDILIGGT